MTALRSGERILSYSSLAVRAARVASGLQSLGVKPGDSVALLMRNDFAFFEAHAGSSLLGAYTVPINWHFRPSEVAHVIRDSGAKVVVVHDDLLPMVPAEFHKRLAILNVKVPPEICAAYALVNETGRNLTALPEWAVWRDAQECWEGPPAPALASVIYTSGTTGLPKGVRRRAPSPEQQNQISRHLERVFGLSEGREIRTAVTGPLYHSAPNAHALSAVHNGNFVVLMPRFDAENLLALIESERITHLHLVPTMFSRLLALPPETRERYDLSSLEFVVHGAAPCAPLLKQRMIDWWGPVVHEYYGCTESGAITMIDSATAMGKPGSVGKPQDDADLAILDADGEGVPANSIGQIYMRLRFYPDFEYIGNPEARAQLERQGLITGGDMGYLDDDGFLYLCDRSNDMVISGGVNIYPAEIEMVLSGMPGVTDCAVFGIPDEEFGERLMAHIQADPDARLDADAIRNYLQQHIANYKVPRHYVFVPTLPREESGKVFKRRLREPYWQTIERRI